MEHKRLRCSKNLESASMAKISYFAKEQISNAVSKQFVETLKISPEYPDVADEINSMGYYILKIGYDINAYCEAVSGSGKVNSEKTDICALLSNICIRSEGFLKRKNIAFLCKVPKESIIIDVDKEKFCYTVLNIILNAAENTPKGGRIRVSVTKTKNYVKIIVGDNGIGMDEETLAHCTEPFYTNCFSETVGKIGLGLTLAKKFAVENGGRLNISSEKGQGTTVSLLLPKDKEVDGGLAVETPMQDIFGGKFSPISVVLSSIEKM